MKYHEIDTLSSALLARVQKSRKCLTEWAKFTPMPTVRSLELRVKTLKQDCLASRELVNNDERST